ncbi:hypothetical protein OAS99_00550 [Candidatus Pelagibacter sp.]|nr:hypothetical protein [Candidatus Pelagibacter sp.]
MKNLLIIIPARGGSLRVKSKNTRKFFNTSLLSLKIQKCLKIKSSELIVSTDSNKVISICKKNKVNFFLRSKKYSGSKATMISAVLELVRYFNSSNNLKLPRYIAILPSTYPFVKKTSIIKALNLLIKNKNLNSICSYSESLLHPYDFVEVKKNMEFNKIKINNKGQLSFERTQDFPMVKVLSGAIRITKTEYFLKLMKNKSPLFPKTVQDVKSCIGLKISKKEAFDINSITDFNNAKKIYKKKNLFIL